VVYSKFKVRILRFINFGIYVFLRIILRVRYGKKRRDQLFSIKYFKSYHKVNQRRFSILWSASKYGYDGWEPRVSTFLKGKTGELFVDIGASVGYYTVLLANNFKEVIAIEPEAESVSSLRQNTAHLENVCVMQEAVSNEEGEITFYVSPTIGRHTMIPLDEGVYVKTKVKTRTLESILGSKTASLVKVDTEGAELEILKSVPPELVESWLIEAHWGEQRKRELEESLTKKGYEIKWISPSHIFAYNDISAGM